MEAPDLVAYVYWFNKYHRMPLEQHFRVSYRWVPSLVEAMQPEYQERFSHIPPLGPGWTYEVHVVLEAVPDEYSPKGWEPGSGYELLASGFATALEAAYVSAKNTIPREGHPFISHTIARSQAAFRYAREFEWARGEKALHDLVSLSPNQELILVEFPAWRTTPHGGEL